MFIKESVAAGREMNGSDANLQPGFRSAYPQRKRIKVLLADDHAAVRQGLSAGLGLNSDIEIVGEAADGLEAVEKARKLGPDVILMDISMPRMNGVEATRLIHSEFPHICIIGLSMYDKDAFAAAMLQAGASRYCIKGCATGVLLAEIRGAVE